MSGRLGRGVPSALPWAVAGSGEGGRGARTPGTAQSSGVLASEPRAGGWASVRALMAAMGTAGRAATGRLPPVGSGVVVPSPRFGLSSMSDVPQCVHRITDDLSWLPQCGQSFMSKVSSLSCAALSRREIRWSPACLGCSERGPDGARAGEMFRAIGHGGWMDRACPRTVEEGTRPGMAGRFGPSGAEGSSVAWSEGARRPASPRRPAAPQVLLGRSPSVVRPRGEAIAGSSTVAAG